MIGVLADDAEHRVASEFFELFKTPWGFYRSDLEYDVLVCSDAELRNSSAKLILVYGAGPKAFDQENGIEILAQRSNTVLSYKGDRIPVYGSCLTFKGAAAHALVDEHTREAAALEIASSGQTFVRVGFDLFQEIHHLLTHGQPSIHARIPALELHIALLRDLIIARSITLIEIPAVPAGYNFIACLTHDVDHVGIRNHKADHTMFGFLYRAIIGSLINFCRGRKSVRQLTANWKAAFSLPFVHLGLAKDFWNQFDRYIEIERGLTSTFFVIPKKGDSGQTFNGPAPSKRAARYDLAKIGHQLRRLISFRREIALHGIDAWHDPAKGRMELETIRRLTGESDIGVRMHWLFFSEQSPATLEKAGFSYDSTVGYNETVGYRAGTTQAFKPLEVERMLELPMHIMDTAMFYPAYMNLSPKRARTVVDDLVENASRFNGVLTVNWHDRSIAPERLWGDFYIDLLDDLKKKGAWFATAAETVSWFRKRRSAVIESVVRDGDAIRAKVSVNQNNDNLPGLRVRVHHNAAKQTHLSGQAGSEGQFVEVSLNCSKEVEIAL
jgi:peptidoglycan/xylan/chitin deacetylase (PgdA/CDA1 family)